MADHQPPKKTVLQKIAKIIVDYRYIIFILFAVAAVFCVFSIGKVKLNSDLTAFLPDDTETRKGLSIMEEEFSDFDLLDVMVSNITYEKGLQIRDRFLENEHITAVTFDDTEKHFKNSAALFTLLFDISLDDSEAGQVMEEVRSIVKPYDSYIFSSNLGAFQKQLAREMSLILILAAIVIFGVLLLTSRSYFEVVIFAIVFVFAALLNMGTNFWFGQISSITNTIAVIMQLALAIDYAIIFAHRYQAEAAFRPDAREAVIEALAKSIPEILSSSLTTIAGLLALTLMQFRLGYDMGIVLAKGIVCSMLTVFLLMPGLILLFPKPLKKTQHRRLVPNIEGWGRFLTKRKYLFIVVFAVLLIPSVILSGKVHYSFSYIGIDELIPSENTRAYRKITDTFALETQAVILVPAGNAEGEKQILKKVEALDGVNTATGLANIKVDEEHALTDAFTPRMFSELLDIDIEQAKLLYAAYGLEHKEYQPVFGSDASYSVPLVDMLLYAFEKMDQGAFTLNEEQEKNLLPLREELEQAVLQLRGKNWDRLILTISIPVEGEESEAFLEETRKITKEVYPEDDVLIVGQITSAKDLKASYNSDSVLISLLTILFVFTVILLTFRSLVGAAILVFVIQGSIWINFACTFISGMTCSFVTNMIVSAIQMGATIDYAIVIMSRYRALRGMHPKKEAMVLAVNESFPTVITSGLIMTVAGFLIAYRISDVYVGHIGLGVGRGALISMLLVLSVLPQLILLLDTAIEKTSFQLNLFPKGGKQT